MPGSGYHPCHIMFFKCINEPWPISYLSICQHLRNKKPLLEAGRNFLDQSDVKLDLSGCPMAATCKQVNVKSDIGLSVAPELVDDVCSTGATNSFTLFSPRANYLCPYECPFLLEGNEEVSGSLVATFLMDFFRNFSWISLCSSQMGPVGKKKEGETVMIWRKGIYMDTIWQAIRTMVGDYFMEMTTGSFLFGFWMNLMGSEIDRDEGAYVDSMGSVLNPEMVRVEGYGSVEREALLFGHIYEGEGGKVKFRKTEIREAGSVECRAVVMPGVMVDCEGSLDALSLAIKGETIK